MLLLALLACPSKTPPGETGADTADSAADSGGETADSGTSDTSDASDTGDTSDTSDTSDTGDSSDTGDTPDTGDDTAASRDWATGIVEVEATAGPYASLGYQITTLEIQSSYAVPFVTPDGRPPRFNVLWPVADAPGVAHPVTIFLHGGSTDVDSAKDPDGESDRCTLAYAQGQAGPIVNTSSFSRFAAMAGHIVVVPMNSFCDGWAGLGPDDPIDTTHAGEALAQAALGYVLYGQARQGVDLDHVTLGGSSLGGIGSPWTLTRNPEIDALIFDSAVGDMRRYCAEETYSAYDFATRQRRCEHILGGAPWTDEAHTLPSAWYPRYVEHSLELLIGDGTVTTPVFQSYNDQDPLCPGDANRDLTAAMDAMYAPAGIRYTAQDSNHSDPIHGQITYASMMYVGWGAHRFTLGHSVVYTEAEEDGGADRVGSPYVAGPTDQWMSKAAGRRALTEDGAGVMWGFTVPPVPAGQAGTVVVFLRAADATDLAAVAAVVRVSEAGVVLSERSVTAGDLSYDPDGGFDDRYPAFAAATLNFTPTGAGPLTAEVEVTGVANVFADVAVTDW